MRYTRYIIVLVVVVFLSVGYGFVAQLVPAETREAKSAKPNVVEGPVSLATEPNAAGAGKPVSAEAGAVGAVCELICEGKFDAADAVVGEGSRLSRLAKMVQQYKDMGKRREEARRAAHDKQFAELEKLQAETDVNDINDVNDLPRLFAVIAKASEFADKQQRQKLLSDAFVSKIFDKAIEKGGDFEAEGKWLDSYIYCYSWLQGIDTENEAYSEYADRLLEKANIVASFQDSPCETRNERYSGVKKEMFVLAIEALNRGYVSIIDYSDMMGDAIKRCGLLGEVVSLSFADIAESLSTVGNSGESFSPPDSEELSAWSAGLGVISDEVKQSPTGVSKKKFVEAFEKVLELNETTVELPEKVLVAQFAEAALSALDPYTVIVWPRQVQEFEKMMTNEFQGIGIEISKPKGLLTVMSLLPDTPAYKSGLDAGDVIVAADGVPTKDMSLTCAVRKITGPAGTDVKLTIKRPGEEETRDITITRAKITVPTIRGWQRTKSGKWLYIVDEGDRIAYVRITGFSPETATDLEEVLDELEAAGLKGLILDLRFNTGGLLEAATAVADKFLKEGAIVSTRPRFGVWTWISAREENTHPDYPVVALINSGSASASEIVAGTLADSTHERAILVGERTHGKGSVQGITSFPGGGAQLKYTMAYYHLPSGQRVESRETMEKQNKTDWGVGPDIEIELRSDEVRKMIEMQRDNDVLGQVHDDESSKPLKKYTLEETIAADPQLAVGILVAKSKLIEMQSAE